MKAVWIVMAFIFCSTSYSRPDHSHPTCSSPNPFLQNFRTPVQLFKAPVILANSHCKGEWDVYGSCCNPGQLLTHFRLDKHRIKKAASQVARNFKQLKDAIKKIRDLLLQESVMPNERNDPAIELFHARAKQLIGSPAFDRYFGFLANMTVAEFAQFNSKHKHCWEEMIRVRASSLCTICSGRSHEFFQNQKGLVSKESCSEILSSCSLPLLDLLKLVKGIHAIHPLFQHLKEYGIKTGIRRKLDTKQCKVYSKVINSSHINSLVESFLINGDRNEETDSILCSTFLHLSSKTFIEFIQSLFRKPILSREVKFDQSLASHMKEHNKSIAADLQKRNPPTSRRLGQGQRERSLKLQPLPTEPRKLHSKPVNSRMQDDSKTAGSKKNNFLQGDVVMYKSDPNSIVRSPCARRRCSRASLGRTNSGPPARRSIVAR